MISKQETEKIAKLARLGLSEKEIEKFQKELSSILGYIEKLGDLDVSLIEPTFHPFESVNVTRKDSEKKKDFSKKLVDLAPEEKEGCIKVKSVF